MASHHSRKWERPTPPAVHKTAEDVLKGLEGPRSFAAASVVMPSDPLDIGPAALSMAATADVVLDLGEADALVAPLFALDETFAPRLVNTGGLGGLAPLQTLTHPAFIRAAARRGAVFYYGSDRKVHRYTLGQDERRDLKRLESPPTKDIDPGFFWNPPWMSDLAAFVENGDNVLLIGPAGSGKTQTVEQVFKARTQKCVIVNCTPSMTADDMEGRMDLVAGETKFTLASPALACKEGYGLLLDESDACPAETLYSLYRILNKQDMHILRLGGEGVVPRHENTRIVGTQNTHGQGDERGLHHGRAYQDAAFLDRWDQRIAVTYPEPENEVLILRKRTGVSAASAEAIVNAAKALRLALSQDEVMFVCSIRRTLAVAGNIRAGMTPERAWQFAVTNGISTEDASKANEVIQRIYGTRLKMKPPAT